jgi:hypothetical protein
VKNNIWRIFSTATLPNHRHLEWLFKFRAIFLQGHVYPDSAIAAGWLLTAFAMVQVPIFGAIALCKSRKRLADAFRYIQDKKFQNLKRARFSVS